MGCGKSAVAKGAFNTHKKREKADIPAPVIHEVIEHYELKSFTKGKMIGSLTFLVMIDFFCAKCRLISGLPRP